MSTTTAVYALTKPTNLGDAGIWGTPVDANFDTIDDLHARPKIVQNAPTVGATTTLDCSLARVFVFTVTQATTIAFSNVPASTFAVELTLVIVNGSAFALTWPASVSWNGGVTPTLKAGGRDVVKLITRDGGIIWNAALWNSTPGPLFQKSGLSTSSTSDTSLASFSLPGNTLLANNQQLRITIVGTETTQAGTINIKFGATAICNTPIAATNNFALTILVTRTGAATQLSNATVLAQVPASPGTVGLIRTTPAETLANAITIDFRGSVTSGGSLGYDSIVVELLAVA